MRAASRLSRGIKDPPTHPNQRQSRATLLTPPQPWTACVPPYVPATVPAVNVRERMAGARAREGSRGRAPSMKESGGYPPPQPSPFRKDDRMVHSISPPTLTGRGGGHRAMAGMKTPMLACGPPAAAFSKTEVNGVRTAAYGGESKDISLPRGDRRPTWSPIISPRASKPDLAREASTQSAHLPGGKAPGWSNNPTPGHGREHEAPQPKRESAKHLQLLPSHGALLLLVWSLPENLSDMVGPARGRSPRRHSFSDHRGILVPPPH